MTVAKRWTGSEWEVVGTAGGLFIGARAYRTTSVQAAANAATTAVQFNAESYDDGGFHDNVTNNTRFTIPTGQGGKYRIHGTIEMSGTMTSGSIRVMKNGAIAAINDYSATRQYIGVDLSLVATDYIELAVFNGSGGSLNITTGEDRTWLAVQKVG